MRKRVYLAGPISKGDLAHNIRQADAAFFALASAGLAPWCPQWSCYSTGPKLAPVLDATSGRWEFGDRLMVYAEATAAGGGKMTHTDWLDTDLAWVGVADAVLRLPGESTGADKETAHAEACGVPVFHSVADVIAWANG